MEHLPYPRQSKPVLQVDIPYLSGYEFDHLDFKTYPDRMGWAINGEFNIERFDFRCLTHLSQQHPTEYDHNSCVPAWNSNDCAAFTQSWLFFGLIEVFLEEPFNKKRLIRKGVGPATGSKFIRTTVLETMLLDSVQRRRKHRSRSALQYKAHALATAIRVSTQWDKLPGGDHTFSAIFLSVRTLTVYLTEFFYRALRVDAGPYDEIVPNPSTRSTVPMLQHLQTLEVSCTAQFLENRMRNNGWCAHQIMNLLHSQNIMIMYYLSSLGREEPPWISHQECSQEKCIAYNTNNDAYQTRHIRDDCYCEFVSAPIERLAEITECGGIPLINLSALGDEEVELDVIPANSSSCYTAISHVWIDGLGNPRSNALPRCKLRKLARQTFALEPKAPRQTEWLGSNRSVKSQLVWLDTLCIPVSMSPMHTELRTKAIDKMALIYAGAKRVLVLDQELERVCSAFEPDEMVFARMLCSKWNTRCWTLQEAALGLRLHFQFRDLAIEPRDIKFMPGTQTDKTIANAAHRLMLKSLLVDSLYPSSMTNKTRLLRNSSGRSLTQVAGKNFIKWMSKSFTHPRWEDWCDPEVSEGFAQQYLRDMLLEALLWDRNNRVILGRHVFGADTLSAEDTRNVFLVAWQNLGRRSTTKAEDIHAVLANLTDHSAAQIMSIQCPGERTKTMLGVMGSVPLALLTNKYSRPYAGLDHADRWVPSAPGPENLLATTLLHCTNQGLALDLHSSRNRPRLFLVGTASKRSCFCFEYAKGTSTAWLWVQCELVENDQLQRHDDQTVCVIIGEPDSMATFDNLDSRGARVLVVNQRPENPDVIFARYDCPLSFRVKQNPPSDKQLPQWPIVDAVETKTDQNLVIDYHFAQEEQEKVVLRSHHINTSSHETRALHFCIHWRLFKILEYATCTISTVALMDFWLSGYWILLIWPFNYTILRLYNFALRLWIRRCDSLVHKAWRQTFDIEWVAKSKEADVEYA